MASTDDYKDYEDDAIDDKIPESEEFEEPDQDDNANDNEPVDIADHVARANVMTRRNNVCMTFEGPATSRWISKVKQVDCGIRLADGDADTIVYGSGWLQQSTILRTANIQ